MSEEARNLAQKYIENVEKFLKDLKLSKKGGLVEETNLRYALETAKAYLSDAKHYLPSNPATSLSAIAYSEGVLDCLRFLKLIDSSWETRK